MMAYWIIICFCDNEASFNFRGYMYKCHCGAEGPLFQFKSEKSTVFPVCHAMMAPRGSRGIASLILNLSIRLR